MVNLKHILIGIGILLLIFGAGFGVGWKTHRNASISPDGPQVDTTHHVDTVWAEKPKEATIPKGYELVPTSTLRAYDEVLAAYKDSLAKKPILVTEHDTTYIAVPITEHHFTDNKTYECAVQGYGVDMLWHKSFQTTTTITQWKTEYKPYKWTLSPNIAMHAGQDFLSASAGISADIGISQNGRWRLEPEAGYGILYVNGEMRHGFYGAAKIKFNIIQAK